MSICTPKLNVGRTSKRQTFELQVLGNHLRPREIVLDVAKGPHQHPHRQACSKDLPTKPAVGVLNRDLP